VAKRPRSRDLVFLPGQLLGAAVLFVPFADGLVPARLLVGASEYEPEPGVGMLALPAFLILPVIASSVRQAVAGPLSRTETWIAWIVSAIALLVTCFVVLTQDFEAIVGPTFILASVGAIAVLAFTRKGRLPAHVHAHVALLTAWIVNASLAVVSAVVWAEPDAGCWVAAGAVAACVLEAALRSRDALRRRGAADDESVRPYDSPAPDPHEIAYGIPELVGVAVLFLPFAWGYSPLDVLAEDLSDVSPLMIPFLIPWLSAVFIASTARQAFFGPLTRWEARAAYVLAIAALITPSLLCASAIMDGRDAPISQPLVLALAFGIALVLVATRRKRVPTHVHAHVAMLLSWVPNTVLWLTATSGDSGWDVGAHLAIVACVAYGSEAAVRLTLAASRVQRDGHSPKVDALPDERARATTGER
jgi:hypothetical protein